VLRSLVGSEQGQSPVGVSVAGVGRGGSRWPVSKHRVWGCSVVGCGWP